MSLNSPTDVHTNENGANISWAFFMTSSWVASTGTLSCSERSNSMYNLVMFLSRGIHRTVPAVSEWMTTLLHRSGKSVSITPTSRQYRGQNVAKSLHEPSRTPHLELLLSPIICAPGIDLRTFEWAPSLPIKYFDLNDPNDPVFGF